jgi:diguanylate cyclase (GGDEF)-like protein/PAS domain S-box-containing protein
MQKNKEHTYLDYVEEAVVKYDSDGCLEYYNDKFQVLYSYTDSDLQLGVHFSELGKIDLQNGNVVTAEYLGAEKEYLAIKAKYRKDLTGSFTVQLQDGRFIKTTDRLLPDGGFISVQTDVTDLATSRRALETKNIEAEGARAEAEGARAEAEGARAEAEGARAEAEGARAEAEAWLQVLESSPSATLLRDSSFIIRNASHGWTRLTGFSRDETIGRDFVSFLVEEDQDRAQDARQVMQKAMQTGRDEALNVWTLRTNSGAKLQVTSMNNAVAGLSAQEAMSVLSVTNITDLATQKALADTLLNRNAAMIISQSNDWKIQTCSDAWINQLGYTREETVGQDLTEFMEPEDAVISKEFRETLKLQKASKNVVRNTLRFRTKAGELRQIELQSVVEEIEGNLLNIITLVDFTDMMTAQHQLRMLVEHDELTGLYSRRGLKERFSDGKRKKTAGVYIFDLDHFKSVNDSYGHEAGDVLLSAMGQTMTRLTETGGCAARLGGEEFAIIRPWQGWEEAKEFGEALRLALEQTVVVSGGRTINRTASIGIAKLGTSEALSEAMHLADHLAREAKKRGRNMVCAGEEEELRALELRGAFITVEEVQLALEAGEFYYEVQPIWNVKDRRIEGFEALIRWQKADGTVLSPLQFVSVFDEVTREPAFAALNTAMRKDVLTKHSDFPEAYVSFNYTLEQLAYVGASEELVGVYGSVKDFPGRVIMIELSEMALSQRGNLDVLRAELKALGENGFIIALDDFGVASSNLNRLQELPINVVKLDKTLIDDLTTSERVRSIVSGIAMIVRSLNMKVIVEGVETTHQAQALMHHHIVTQQGYVHAKPMRPEEVVGQLSKIGADVAIGESAEKIPDIL